MAGALVMQVRSFNRCVTQAVGALQDNYLARERPLSECRLLFEISTGGGSIAQLRTRLGLDSGYLSRLLRSLERQGLVSTRPATDDRRARIAELSAAGVREVEELNRRSDLLAESILEPLTPQQRKRLTDSMATVERLLRASTISIDDEIPTAEAAQHCLQLYYRELNQRFELGFDPSKSILPSTEVFAPPRGLFLVMRMAGEPVGCGGLTSLTPEVAYLKRMWIEPQARGIGLARRLLVELEKRARALGYRTLRLETNKSLTEAQQLYRSSGYIEVTPFNDELYAQHWFEKQIHGE
jgi:DNA-binding MarR family transcriptional regulator/GNAT superfamily N-acetyltransferase